MAEDWREKIKQWVTPVYWREALCGVPALPVILLLGIASGRLLPSLVAAGAAFSVGLGAARSLNGHRWGAMIAATLGMTASALLGSALGNHGALALIVSGLLAGITAALAARNQNWWWVSLQLTIAFLVASHFPGTILVAAARAALVFAGGAIQIAFVATLAWLIPGAGNPLPPQPQMKPLAALWPLITTARAALCTPVALIAAQSLHLKNDYWAPMTALVVLKPHFAETGWRGFARIIGTVAGCVLASCLDAAIGSNVPVVAILLGLAAGTAFACQRTHYAVSCFTITVTAVLLLDLAQGAPLANAAHRIEATLTGGLVALAFAAIASPAMVKPQPPAL